MRHRDSSLSVCPAILLCTGSGCKSLSRQTGPRRPCSNRLGRRTHDQENGEADGVGAVGCGSCHRRRGIAGRCGPCRSWPPPACRSQAVRPPTPVRQRQIHATPVQPPTLAILVRRQRTPAIPARQRTLALRRIPASLAIPARPKRTNTLIAVCAARAAAGPVRWPGGCPRPCFFFRRRCQPSIDALPDCGDR